METLIPVLDDKTDEHWIQKFWYVPVDQLPEHLRTNPNGTKRTERFMHREDGPAYYYFKNILGGEYNSLYEEWRCMNLLHRYDGPAITDSSYGVTEHMWWVHGSQVNKQEYLTWINEMGMDIENLNPEDKVLIDLKWKLSYG